MFGLFTKKPKYQEGTVVLQGEDPKYGVRYVLDTAEAIAIVDGVDQHPKPMNEVPFPTGWGNRHIKISLYSALSYDRADVHAWSSHGHKLLVQKVRLADDTDSIKEGDAWPVTEMAIAYAYLKKLGLKDSEEYVPFPISDKIAGCFYNSLMYCGKAECNNEGDISNFFIRKGVGWGVRFFHDPELSDTKYSPEVVARLWESFWVRPSVAIPVVEDLEDNLVFWRDDGTTYLYFPYGGRVRIDAKDFKSRAHYLTKLLELYLAKRDVRLRESQFYRPKYLSPEATEYVMRKGMSGVPYDLLELDEEEKPLKPDVLPNGRVSKFDQFYE